MAKKQYFLTIDNETTTKDHVADFAAVVTDRQGKIHAQCAILVTGIFGNEELFYDPNTAGAHIWSKASVERRTQAYNDMLTAGTRMLASVAAINRWLERAKGKYDPELTAYNLPFDVDKCAKTNIDLTIFPKRFCLWAAASGTICQTKAYKQFILDNHLFNKPTEKGNMTFSTNAESVTGFLNGQMTDEPHTALEDIIGWELPILKKVLTIKGWRDRITPYNWRSFQVKDHFGAK